MRPRSRSGLTLLEALLVVVLLALLAALLSPVSQKVRARAEAARCMTNLRALHAALGAYVAQNGRWPQQPDELTDRAAQQWWVEELRPFGMTQEAWICPTLGRILRERNTSEARRPHTHYGITRFDARQFTPYRWRTQPWAIELGNVHGNGQLMIFPDGHIQPFGDIYREKFGKPLPPGLTP